MAVKDYLKPVTEHTSGIPSNIRLLLQNTGPHTSQKFLSIIQRAYEKQCRLIEATLEGKDLEGMPIPEDKEELAAEMVAHQVLDTAFMHDRLRAGGALVGDFPFDWLADIILPKQEDTTDGTDTDSILH